MFTRAIVTTLAMMACSVWMSAAQRSSQPAKPLTLAVSHAAKVIEPGDVVLVTIQPSAQVATVEGTAFDRRVSFWPSNSGPEWRGLVGVPLETPAGANDLLVQATGT